MGPTDGDPGGEGRGKITSVAKVRVSMTLGVAVKVQVALVTDQACHKLALWLLYEKQTYQSPVEIISRFLPVGPDRSDAGFDHRVCRLVILLV